MYINHSHLVLLSIKKYRMRSLICIMALSPLYFFKSADSCNTMSPSLPLLFSNFKDTMDMSSQYDANQDVILSVNRLGMMPGPSDEPNCRLNYALRTWVCRRQLENDRPERHVLAIYRIPKFPASDDMSSHAETMREYIKNVTVATENLMKAFSP